jgi:WhiB family transcriptional regulator, redox-sensing transcriptional regulator
MYAPGTTATLTGLAEVEADSERAAARPRIAPAILPGSLSLPGIPNGLVLPCGDDPELFFAESPDDVESAKQLCQACPARLTCLAGAMERREPWGVWGGELFLRGEVVPRKRPRGRPRKTDVAA